MFAQDFFFFFFFPFFLPFSSCEIYPKLLAGKDQRAVLGDAQSFFPPPFSFPPFLFWVPAAQFARRKILGA